MSNIAEFPDLSPDEEHTPDSLEQKLHEYAAAVRSEFAAAEAAANGDPKENADQFAADFAKDNLGNSLAQIAWLSQNSTSDSVRLNACKFLTELAREDARKDGDPFKELMRRLTKPAKSESSTGEEQRTLTEGGSE